jgi:hypothetical protein
MRNKLYILAALMLGMIQIAVLNFIPREWVPPYFSFTIMVDIVFLFIVFHKIDKS